jgi:hypothetical protein
MSALGQKQTFAQKAMSALPLKADMCSAFAHVCFGPIAEIKPIANVDLFRHAQHLLRRVAMASNPQSRFQVRS